MVTPLEWTARRLSGLIPVGLGQSFGRPHKSFLGDMPSAQSQSQSHRPTSSHDRRKLSVDVADASLLHHYSLAAVFAARHAVCPCWAYHGETTQLSAIILVPA